jgi:thermitase
MRRSSLPFGLALAAALCWSAAHPPRRAAAGADPLADQLVVRYTPGATTEDRTRALSVSRARVIGAIPQLGIETLAAPASAAAALARTPGVLWVEPNRRRRVLLEPNDPAYSELDANLPLDPEAATWYEWDARILQCEEGWEVWPGRFFNGGAKGSAAVRIAVIDSGTDYDHPDFRNGGDSSDAAQGGQLERALDRTITAGKVKAGARDVFGHGTHVMGIAAAGTNNGIGVSGNGYNATVLSIRVIDAAGSGTSADLAQAIVYAADQGCLLCNVSLGDYEYSQAEQDAVEYAWRKGMLVIAAAGNDGVDNKPNYPGALSHVLAVSATSRAEVLAMYSNFGDYIGLAAPGGDFDFETNWFLGVYSTMPTYEVTLNGPDYGVQMNYDYLQGTSMAAPQVTGLAALYAGMKGYTQETPSVCLKIWRALQRGCEDILGGSGNWSPYYGYGRINVLSTLSLDRDPNPRGATAGCVTGQVRYKGTRVANAVITAKPTGGGQEISASSRADGGYRIVNAPAGEYTLKATIFGESQTLKKVKVPAGCDTPGVVFNIGRRAGTPPDAPANLRGEALSRTRIRLHWKDRSEDETRFLIYRAKARGSFARVASVRANTTSYTSSKLTRNTLYRYRVRAQNQFGLSPNSNTVQLRTER